MYAEASYSSMRGRRSRARRKRSSASSAVLTGLSVGSSLGRCCDNPSGRAHSATYIAISTPYLFEELSSISYSADVLRARNAYFRHTPIAW